MQETAEALLGPRWTPKELRAFYILLKAHGEHWEKLEERLPGRTAAMARSLFDMHRGYLALPEASAEGFCAVMMDHYKAQYERDATHVLPLRPRSAAGDVDNDRGAENDPRRISVDANRGLGKRENLGSDASSKRSDGDTPQNKKKRRLERLLSLEGGDQLEPQALEQLRIRSESDTDMPEASREGVNKHGRSPIKRSGRARRTAAAPRPARWWLQDPSFNEIQGRRFDLPWYCWFYSCDDDAFFQHNEFVDCLNRMGLGQIHAAARPIWSSVRLSMGHPRRLSPVFFAQEKLKLEEFRKLRRRTDQENTRSTTWPFLRPVQLNSGAKVIVWMEMYQRFLMCTVVDTSIQEGVCTVIATTHGIDGSELETRLLCPLSSVMLLDFLQPSRVEKNLEPPGTASLLRRSGKKKRAQTPLPMHSSQPSNAPFTSVVAREDGDFRESRLRAVIAVKDLLQRKEQIVSAMAKLNERAAKLQRESLQANGLDKSQLWTTPTSFSSAALRDVSWAHSGVRKALQEQQSWLTQNLNSTNAHLKAALLRLNTFTSSPEDTSRSFATDETLSVDEMRWAIQFLNDSQQRAASLVETAAGSPAPPHNVLSQTNDLISSCLCLMSVFTSADRSDFSTSVPPMVLHTLISRMIELLKPSHADNMDVYTELKMVAEGVQAQLAIQNAMR